jgi:uncharacterized membrane protein YhaH (DUF805 family)
MPEAGWYDDPEHPEQLRYWDGSRWTDQRQARDVPPPPPPPFAAETPSAAWTGETGGTWGTPGAGTGGSVLTGAAPPRTFVEAIKVCLTKYVDGKGRASRSEYWYFALFTFLIGLVTGGVGDILLLLPSITVSVRRLHDIGKSAWALLWVLLPVIGWIVLIVYAVRPGEPHMNQFG